MKSIIPTLILSFMTVSFFACGGGDKKAEEKEQQAVETQVKKDQQAMDSLEKAIRAQIDAVDEDSLMKVEH